MRIFLGPKSRIRQEPPVHTIIIPGFSEIRKPKLIHYHFKLGKVESVVKVRRDSMSGPFKAGMD